MQINLSGHHIEVTDSLRVYVTEKLERVKRHFDQVMDVHVILSVEKLEKKAEANLRMNGKPIFAESIDEDMYAAIDSLVDKLDRQVIKHKEKSSNYR